MIARGVQFVKYVRRTAAPPGSSILTPLTGNRTGRYSVRLTANARVTFGWGSDGAVVVDIEDYH